MRQFLCCPMKQKINIHKKENNNNIYSHWGMETCQLPSTNKKRNIVSTSGLNINTVANIAELNTTHWLVPQTGWSPSSIRLNEGRTLHQLFSLAARTLHICEVNLVIVLTDRHVGIWAYKSLCHWSGQLMNKIAYDYMCHSLCNS